MRRLLGSLASVAVSSLVLVWVGCSSSAETAPPTAEQAFCTAVSDSLKKCTDTATSCAAVVTDCAKITTLLNPSLLQAATTCMKSSTCDNGGPLACLGSSIGDVKTSAPQTAFAADYCTSCSVVPGDTCTSAFYPSGGASGLGVLLLPFGDGIVGDIDRACTSSSLGKTVCQSSFSTCLGVEAAKSLAKTLSADTASCLVSSIQAGIANAGGGDGGSNEGSVSEGGTADGGDAGVCNSVVNGAPKIVSENVAGSAPAPTGGTIVDGTYFLVSVRTYGGSDPPQDFKDTAVFSNGTKIDTNFIDGTGADPATDSAVFTASGTTFTRSFTCPGPETRVRPYSATASTFTIFVGATVYNYAKQ